MENGEILVSREPEIPSGSLHLSLTVHILSQVGGQGQGPGEYRYLSGVVIGAADSVYLWEIVTNRILVL